MKFGPVSLNQAVGSILAHSLSVGGIRLRKGKSLRPADIKALQDAGVATVVVAESGPNDVLENEAAEQLARALAGRNTQIREPSNGRCNLYASSAGIVQFDPEIIRKINRHDEAITIATLLPNERVFAGQMLATVKIIPYAVDKASLAHVLELSRTAQFSVALFRPLRVDIIQTRLDGQSDTVFEKTLQVTAARLKDLGASVHKTAIVPHDRDALATALKAMDGELILIIGASAIADRDDVIPAAIIKSGGQIERLGMPVDPGNLLCLGWLDARPLIGLPGCARSPKRNGFDWVLERLVAGLRVDHEIIADMGVGGLISEIPDRPMPRETQSSPQKRSQAPVVGALVLAGGMSRRMGPENKLLADLQGQPVIKHIVSVLQTAGLPRPIVVLGHESEQLSRALSETGVTFVHNAQYAEGLSTSIRAGISAIPEHWDGFLICLGDMPEISGQTLMHLKEAFSADTDKDICVPVYQGKRGNPVLWGQRHKARLMALEGDVGAKYLLSELVQFVVEVPVGQPDILTDIDTAEDLLAMKSRWQSAKNPQAQAHSPKLEEREQDEGGGQP